MFRPPQPISKLAFITPKSETERGWLMWRRQWAVTSQRVPAHHARVFRASATRAFAVLSTLRLPCPDRASVSAPQV